MPALLTRMSILPNWRDRRFDRGLDLLFVGDIESESGGFAASRGDFIDQFVQLLLIACGHGDRRAVFGEPQRAGCVQCLATRR